MYIYIYMYVCIVHDGVVAAKRILYVYKRRRRSCFHCAVSGRKRRDRATQAIFEKPLWTFGIRLIRRLNTPRRCVRVYEYMCVNACISKVNIICAQTAVQAASSFLIRVLPLPRVKLLFFRSAPNAVRGVDLWREEVQVCARCALYYISVDRAYIYIYIYMHFMGSRDIACIHDI